MSSGPEDLPVTGMKKDTTTTLGEQASMSVSADEVLPVELEVDSKAAADASEGLRDAPSYPYAHKHARKQSG